MHLTRREKTVVLGGLGGLVLLMTVQFVVRPVMEQISTLRRVATDKRTVLAQMQANAIEYQTLQADVTRLRSAIARQQQGRRILSTIEGIREACGLRKDVLSLKPATAPLDAEYQKMTVEVRLEGVTLAQLIDFLSRLDALDLAGGITSLDIRTTDPAPGLLRATINLAMVMCIENMAVDAPLRSYHDVVPETPSWVSLHGGADCTQTPCVAPALLLSHERTVPLGGNAGDVQRFGRGCNRVVGRNPTVYLPRPKRLL